MFRTRNRMTRVMMMLATGALMLQAAGCDIVQIIQTGLLGVLTGTTLYLASNV